MNGSGISTWMRCKQSRACGVALLAGLALLLLLCLRANPAGAMPVVAPVHATVAWPADSAVDLMPSPNCHQRLVRIGAGDVVAQSCPPPPRCAQDERPCYLRRDANGCLTWRCCKR